ncbi:carbohydrate deacetylase [Trichloromonas sp.]|uniref:carbohydrate deacetylase n=1 Tax=Trichloromonas sp. TaxID=3069249 RepID=UPI002A468AC2|nr:ChbG/HpnK family deacetylase [Trichloromonas sp.]
MIQLIVNADDLGSGPERDRGIFRCFEQGIVTSVSLLANGPHFAEAACEAVRLGMPLGVHLNLSEGRALTGVIAGLTDAAGEFPGKADLRRILAGGDFDAAGARRELAAQLDRVRQAGIVPDHLDSHQHFILFPAATGLVTDLARAEGINALRRPLPAEDPRRDPPPPLGDELVLYRRLAPAASAQIDASALFAPQGLWGMTLLDRLDKQALSALLEEMPDGVWELMVHPGYCDLGRPFSGPERLRETLALTNPCMSQLIREKNIFLTTFGACACAF